MPTHRLTVEYDGTKLHGWQLQRNARTVTGVLRAALADMDVPVDDLGGAGRTDAGVHAVAQVAHLRTPTRLDPVRLVRELNARLPADVCVLSAPRVGDQFHARHDAVARSYVYQVSRRRTAFAKRHVWWMKDPIDTDRMARAAALLPGRHDFAAFCDRPEEHPSTIVVVDRIELATEGALILVRLVASHFLWRMTRRVVGVLVRIGTGELDERRLVGWLAEPSSGRGDDGVARHAAPASGLFLERVVYAGEPPVGPLRSLVPVTAEAPERAAPPPRRDGPRGRHRGRTR